MATSSSSIRKTLTAAVAALTAAVLTATGASVAHAQQGPDVSSWQGADINWGAVRAAGNQYAIVKATEGTWYTNPFFVQQSIGIKAAGLMRGTYHFADVTESAAAQATKYSLITLGNGLPGDLPPVIDFEDSKGLPANVLIGWLHEFLNTTQMITGRRPMIYTYPSFWRNKMGNTAEFRDYPLWIADYNGGPGPTLPLPGGWNAWTFWQATSTASIPGIGGNVDLNYYGQTMGGLNTLGAGMPNYAGLSLAAIGSPTGSADGRAGLQTAGGAIPAGSVG